MARGLTYFGITSFLAVAFTAACGNGGGDDSGDGDAGAGAAAGDGDGEICPFGDCGEGATTGAGATGGDGDFSFNNANIITAKVPDGFTSDIVDGSGNPSFVEVGFPQASIDLIAGAAAGPASADAVFHYPFPDTMVPGNLTFINFQWKAPNGGHTKIMFRITAPDAIYHAYLTAKTCTSQGYCNADMPAVEWQWLGLNYRGQTLNFEVVSTDGTATMKTPPLPIEFSPDPLIGTLYYWASKTRNIKRVSFGEDEALDFIIPGQNVDYACVSCHSVSRDGTTIAFAVGPEHGENISGIQVAPTSDPGTPYIVPTKGATPYSTNVSNGNTEGPIDNLGHNVALNRDGTMMAVNATSPPDNWPSALEIRSARTPGTVIASYPVSDSNPYPWGINRLGIHPEYSPDSSQLAVTLATSDGNMSAWSNTAGGIAILPVMADGSLGQAVEIAVPAAGAYHFYPTWSPDSKYIAFMTSWDNNNNVGSLGNDNAVMHMVPTTGGPYTCPGAGCIELTRGTGYTGAAAQAMTGTTATTWPKFAPFAQGTAQNVYFITFTSRREVGEFGNAVTQLWMFGIDTTVSPDPSFSPFWLPYQEPQDGSLTPYWTEVIPCHTEGDTCNGCVADKEYCLVNTDFNTCQCEPIRATL